MTRFHSKYKEVESGCWEWQEGKYPNGYGQYWNGRAQVGAHRHSYVLFKGAIPEGGHILHKCDNPCCVNPEHLVLGTHTDNMQDKVLKGRHGNKSKLNSEDIPKILLDTRLQREIADEYGVSQSLINKIKRGHIWNSS